MGATRLRSWLFAALLMGSSVAQAQLDPCRRYALQEEKAAYDRCVDEWRDLLPPAQEEMAKSAPLHEGKCGERFARWEAAALADPNDYRTMVQRIDARESVERCDAEWFREHLPREEKLHRGSYAEIAFGTVFLAFGGIGLTAVGGAALGTRAYGDPIGIAIMGGSGAVAGAFATVGAVLLGVGARHRHLKAR